MRATLNHVEKLFAPAEAERVAAEMSASGEDWTYRVVRGPKGTGYSFIEIYDEDGAFVGKA